jgi:Sulfotransferase family
LLASTVSATSGGPEVRINKNNKYDIAEKNNNSVSTTDNSQKIIWPNFFIVGAPRAGTTSLYAYLREVRGVYMPRIKEPLYFASKSIPDRIFGIKVNVVRDRNEYLKLYQNVREEIAIGDASASYLWDRETPRLIHEVIPKARIIIMLRDPVERAFSHYLMHLRDGSETELSFYDALKNDYDKEIKGGVNMSHLYVGYGLYSEQVKRYIETFGKDKVKTVIFEEFILNTKGMLRSILEFLGIDDAELPDNIGEAFNTYSAPRFRHFPRILNLMARLRNRTRDGKENRTDFGKLRSGSDLSERSILRKLLSKRSTKPKVPEEARLFLEDIYHDDVSRLQDILGHPFPWSIITRHHDDNRINENRKS